MDIAALGSTRYGCSSLLARVAGNGEEARGASGHEQHREAGRHEERDGTIGATGGAVRKAGRQGLRDAGEEVARRRSGAQREVSSRRRLPRSRTRGGGRQDVHHQRQARQRGGWPARMRLGSSSRAVAQVPEVVPHVARRQAGPGTCALGQRCGHNLHAQGGQEAAGQAVQISVDRICSLHVCMHGRDQNNMDGQTIKL